MEIGAPELPVGDALQSEILLEADDVADGAVLGGSQVRLGDAALLELLARRQQLGRPQEAADVVGAEGWGGACGHAVLRAEL